MMRDPDSPIILPDAVQLAQAGGRQNQPKYHDVDIGPGGAPIPTRLDLVAGLWEFHLNGLLPVAFAIRGTFDPDVLLGTRREGELLNLARPSLRRMIEPGEVVTWSPIFPIPFLVPRLGCTLLARARTEAG